MLSPFRNAAAWPSQALDSVACVCLWDACACRVWSLCVAGAVVAVPQPGGAVKERGNELCFISFFLWSERAKKDSSSGSEIGGGGCMCVWGESTTFSSLFDCFLVRFLDLFTWFEWFIFFVCFEKSIKKSIMAFAVLWKQSLQKVGQIFETSSPLGTVRVMSVLCASNLFCLCFFLQYYIPDLKLSLCTEVCIRLAKDPLQTK